MKQVLQALQIPPYALFLGSFVAVLSTGLIKLYAILQANGLAD